MFKYYVGDKRRMIKVANASGAGKISLAEARLKIEELRKMLVEGLDPKDELQRQKKKLRKNARNLNPKARLNSFSATTLKTLNAGARTHGRRWKDRF